jgi:hypothetical protein
MVKSACCSPTGLICRVQWEVVAALVSLCILASAVTDDRGRALLSESKRPFCDMLLEICLFEQQEGRREGMFVRSFV